MVFLVAGWIAILKHAKQKGLAVPSFKDTVDKLIAIQHTTPEQFQALVERRDVLKRRRWRLAKKLEALHKRRVAAEQRRRQPRARKKFKPLPEAVEKELAAPLIARLDVLSAEAEAEVKKLDRKIAKLANIVEFPPQAEMIQVKDSWATTYSSQGFGANTYARGRLELTEELLKMRGYETEIRVTREGTPSRGGIASGGGIVHNDYGLFANCPEGVKEALKHWDFSLEDMHRVAKRKALNLKVFNPYIPNYWD